MYSNGPKSHSSIVGVKVGASCNPCGLDAFVTSLKDALPFETGFDGARCSTVFKSNGADFLALNGTELDTDDGCSGAGAADIRPLLADGCCPDCDCGGTEPEFEPETETEPFTLMVDIWLAIEAGG
jgi:hypothetical protein